MVGSRDVSMDGIEFTKKLVEKAAKEKLIIYSGGAKGVDKAAEETAVAEGSAVVSFIADSLLSRIRKKDTINNIILGKLLLISDVKPDAGFSAARAMNRNKYIYTSAYGAFVVESDYNKGGTWSGAIEAMRNEWTKVLVWNSTKKEGNLKLIERGGVSYALSNLQIYEIITKKEEEYTQLDFINQNTISAVSEEKAEYAAYSDENNVTEDIYEIVKDHIANGLSGGTSLDEASKKFNVAKGQMKGWLKRLCKDELIQCVDGIYKKLN